MTGSSAVDFKEIKKPLNILQFSDLHLLFQPSDTLTGINTEDSFRSIIDAARKHYWPPDLILLTGDLSQDPMLATYERLKHHLDGLGLPCYCLPGNHDKPIMHQVLNSEKVSCAARIHAGNWQIMCLDSTIPDAEGGSLSESTLQTLINYLDEFPSKNVLIALHHHPIPIGCAWLDTMMLKNADELFSVLRTYPQVKAIVCGHIHQEMDCTHHNIRLLGTPSTCFQFKPHASEFALDNKPAGFRPLKLYPNGSIETWVERLPELPEGLDFACSGY